MNPSALDVERPLFPTMDTIHSSLTTASWLRLPDRISTVRLQILTAEVAKSPSMSLLRVIDFFGLPVGIVLTWSLISSDYECLYSGGYLMSSSVLTRHLVFTRHSFRVLIVVHTYTYYLGYFPNL